MLDIDARIERIAQTPGHEISEHHINEISRLRSLKELQLQESAMVSVQMTRAEAKAFLSHDFSRSEKYVENLLSALREIGQIARHHHYGEQQDQIDTIKSIVIAALEYEA